jgi:large subunit ribosomal protein L35
MPKLKTHKGAQKRFHTTGSGKFMQGRQQGSHLRRKKAKRTKRMFDDSFEMDKANTPRIQRALPYGTGK